MKLYICWGTSRVPGPRPHACHIAYGALKQAGYEPEFVKTYCSGALPAFTADRREVKRLAGQSWVPLLVTGDSDLIRGSKPIAEWAEGHPASVS